MVLSTTSGFEALLTSMATAIQAGVPESEIQDFRDDMGAMLLEGDFVSNIGSLAAAGAALGLDLDDPHLGLGPEAEPPPAPALTPSPVAPVLRITTGPGSPLRIPFIPVPSSGYSRAPALARWLIDRLWPTAHREIAARVGECESTWRAAAHNTSGEDSRGWWQINVESAANPDLTSTVGAPNQFGEFDPIGNAVAAYAIWRRQGWRAWFNCMNLIGVPTAMRERNLGAPALTVTVAQLRAEAEALGLVEPWLHRPPGTVETPGLVIDLPGPLPEIDLGPLFSPLIDGLTGVIDWLRDMTAAVVEPIGDAVTAITDAVVSLATETIPTLAELTLAATSSVSDLLSILSDTLGEGGAFVANLGGALGDAITEGGSDVAAFIVAALSDVIGGGMAQASRVLAPLAPDATPAEPVRFEVRDV